MGSRPSYQNHQNSSSSHTDYVALPRTLEDPTWFTDSGASNHVTVDKGNLTIVKKYEGKEKLLVGDGNSLHIVHIGI